MSLCAVFPGQGSQYVGMGKEFYESSSMARETFEEASDAIHIDLKRLCFQGPDTELVLTENTQPCLLATSVAAFRAAVQTLDFQPQAVAGHSLGEYSALVAAGSLDLTTATRWVRERGLAMQQAVPAGEGSMAALLGLEDSAVITLCQEASASAVAKRPAHATSLPSRVEPANWNAPGQVVIAGSQDAVQEALSLTRTDARWAGSKAIPLAVSAPFHCTLMEPAKIRMAELFSRALPEQLPKALLCPYVPNRTGRFSQEPQAVIELLIEQMDHPVLWKQSILALLDHSFSTFIEFGPGKVLSGLIKRIAGSVSLPCSLASIQQPDSLHSLEKLLIPTTQNSEKFL